MWLDDVRCEMGFEELCGSKKAGCTRENGKQDCSN